MVAPSSTAISKSPLIPIDSSGSPWRSASLRSERNQPRASSARSTGGGIAISPRSRSPPSAVSASTAVSTASGGQPPFDGSRPTLTCTSASTGRPRARAMRSRTRSRLVRMSGCISSTGDSSTRFCYPRNVMPPLSDLALMIQSRYPFIAVETSEEDRLETALSQVAGDLRVPFFVWTVTNGLHRHGLPNAIYDSQQPLKGLNNVAAMTGEALFLMKDLHRYLTDPAVVRKCLDLAPA